MGVIRLLSVLCLGVAVAGVQSAAGQDMDEGARAVRWKELQQAIFPHRQLQAAGDLIELDAPPRALDAALVPIDLHMSGKQAIQGVYLIIDGNPAPLAAHFTFGPAADPHSLKVRVRVDQYTDIHAVAETSDGRLHVATKFVKAAGGCSAPSGSDESEALKNMGQMRLRLLGAFDAGKPIQAQLMIRHPNFNGMQMNQLTRFVTPARFVKSIDAIYDGGRIFHVDSDISLSSDPVITFGFVPVGKGQMTVTVVDSSSATFHHSFDVPGA
jgi:sulfur-oxidizing protein SoxY